MFGLSEILLFNGRLVRRDDNSNSGTVLISIKIRLVRDVTLTRQRLNEGIFLFSLKYKTNCNDNDNDQIHLKNDPFSICPLITSSFNCLSTSIIDFSLSCDECYH